MRSIWRVLKRGPKKPEPHVHSFSRPLRGRSPGKWIEWGCECGESVWRSYEKGPNQIYHKVEIER